MAQGRVSRRRAALAIRCMPLVGALALAGCLPMSDGGESDGEAHLAPFASSTASLQTEVNRSGKEDFVSLSFTSGLGQPGDGAPSQDDDGGKGHTASIAAAGGSSRDGADVIQATPPAATALASFYKALRELQGGGRARPVTVIHLGDDHIVSDRFSGDLRERLQGRFGNGGRGLMSPTPLKTRDVKFEAGGGQWTVISSAKGGAGPFGLTGVKASSATKGAWLRLNASEDPFEWAEATFETGPGFGAAEVSVDGETKLVPCDGKAKEWKSVRINHSGRELMIRAMGDGPITLMSWMLGSNRPGVRYASLGLPQASALTPGSWDPGVVAADMKKLEPDLIIFSYGSQEGMNDRLDRDYYARSVSSIMARLKQTAPHASLLVIGPPDSARTPAFAAQASACRPLSAQETANYAKMVREQDQRLARWHPPLRLAQVRAGLSRAAAAHGAYFWDWSKVMGGPCGIHAWALAAPPMATADHMHLTADGARHSAKALFFDLMGGYDTSGGKTAAR